MEFVANSFGQLLSKVRDHRIANNYPIPLNYVAEIEDQVCRNTVTSEWCSEKDVPPAPARMGLGDVLRFTKLLAQDLLSGRERVDSDTAKSRAAICSGCEDNVETSGCSGCNQGRVEEAVRRVTDAGVTGYEDRLKTCRWCGCFNRAQVWFPKEILQKNMSDEVRDHLPNHCWKK